MNVYDFPPKKRRNLQSERKAKCHQLYSSDDVIKLYEISRNTLTIGSPRDCLSSMAK